LTPIGVITCVHKDSRQKTELNVKDYHLFISSASNGEKKSPSHPTEYGFCLISEHINTVEEFTTIEPLNSTNYELIPDSYDNNIKSLERIGANETIFFFADSLAKRNCWTTSFNLTEYGLHEYRVGYQEYKKREEIGRQTIIPIVSDTSNEKVLLNYSHENGPLIIDDNPSRLILYDRELEQIPPVILTMTTSPTRMEKQSPASLDHPLRHHQEP